jgi:hypothetical protein
LVFWCAFYLAVFYVIYQIDPQTPLRRDFSDVSTFGAWDYVNALFAITDWPIDYPFWFVRDLFLCVLLSPLLWLVLKKAPFLGAAGMVVIWLANFRFGIFFRPDMLAFFYFGGLLRVTDAPLKIGGRTTLILGLIALVFTALRALGPLYLPAPLSFETFPLTIVMRIFRLVSVVACWGLFLYMGRHPWGRALARYSGVAIFVFATHALVLGLLKYALWPLIPGQSDLWMLAHYALCIGLTLAVVYPTGMLLERYAPKLFSFLIGGRAGGTKAEPPPIKRARRVSQPSG